MTLWMLGLVFALVGVPMIWLAMRTFARDRAIKSWPTAPGVVLSTRVEAENSRERDENGFYHDRMVYRPRVTYTYTVDGQKLDGTRLHRNDDTWIDAAPAQRDVDKYPVNRAVIVLYDPNDPKTAYLEVRRSFGGVFLFAFGSLWIALGTLLTVLHFVT